MYIQMAQGKCDRQDEMRQLIDDWSTEMAGREGWLGGTYGFTDDGRFVGVVRYESAAACERLFADEVSKKGWATAQGLCQNLEMHESGDVTMVLEGGSDSAGFVQVMTGRVADADRMRHLISDEMTAMLHQARPEILGATLAIEPDGRFMETIGFTDEATARQGEQMEMPADVRAELESAMAEVQYADLHHPWFASHH